MRRLVVFTMILAFPIFAQTTIVVSDPFVLKPKSSSSQPDFMLGKSYALVIGIDAYQGKWARLENAVNDARAIADLLSRQFQFERVDTLFDEQATRKNIIDTIVSIGRTLRAEDRLLIYYSGHGWKEPPYDKGYWVPVDATESSMSQYISNVNIQELLGDMKPLHVLLVADACFAGDIITRGVMRYEFEENLNFYRKVAALKSRKAMTSGGDEPVIDGGSAGHSIFTYYFIEALKGINKPYFSAGEVFDRLRIPVGNNARQNPLFQPIRDCGDAGGEFLFLRR